MYGALGDALSAPVATNPFDLEIEALAHVLQSEAGNYSEAERLAVGWVVRNRARKSHTTIYAMEFPWREQHGGSPPFASIQTPVARDYHLAKRILQSPLKDDPTGAATSYFEPDQQDKAAKLGAIYRANRKTRPELKRFAPYHDDADTIRSRWQARGERPLATVGRFELWHTPRAA
jgi:hypothetical protein